MRGFIAKHVLEECQEATVSCNIVTSTLITRSQGPYAMCGCYFTGPRKFLELHAKECNYESVKGLVVSLLFL